MFKKCVMSCLAAMCCASCTMLDRITINADGSGKEEVELVMDFEELCSLPPPLGEFFADMRDGMSLSEMPENMGSLLMQLTTGYDEFGFSEFSSDKKQARIKITAYFPDICKTGVLTNNAGLAKWAKGPAYSLTNAEGGLRMLAISPKENAPKTEPDIPSTGEKFDMGLRKDLTIFAWQAVRAELKEQLLKHLKDSYQMRLEYVVGGKILKVQGGLETEGSDRAVFEISAPKIWEYLDRALQNEDLISAILEEASNQRSAPGNLDYGDLSSRVKKIMLRAGKVINPQLEWNKSILFQPGLAAFDYREEVQKAREHPGPIVTMGRASSAGIYRKLSGSRQKPAQPLGISWGEEGGVVVIESAAPGSPAEKAGLQAGDRLVRLDGVKIKSQTDVPVLMQSSRINSVIKFEIQRANRYGSMLIDVKLDEQTRKPTSPADSQGSN